MTRLIFCSASVLLLFYAPCSAQEWIRSYGTRAYESGGNIHATADGGFFTAGIQETSFGSGVRHFWVVRFDSTGRLLWDRRFGRPGISATLTTSSLTRDGGMMIGGYDGASGTETALMYRIDSAGNELWMKAVDNSGSDHFRFLIERKEGGYLFGGNTTSKSDPQGNFWLLRYDNDRTLLWEQEYDNGAEEQGRWGIETDDGGAMLVGQTLVDGREKYWLVQVDSSGMKQWDSVYSSDPDARDTPAQLLQTGEGNIALIGGTLTANRQRGTAWLLVVNRSGEILIDEHYGSPLATAYAWGGRQTFDGGFILAGHTTYSGHNQQDMILMKTNPDGTLQWEQSYGGTGVDYLYDVIETSDGYLAVGSSNSSSIVTGGGNDLVVVKAAYIPPSPAAARLVAPANGAVGQPGSPTLTWEATPTATRYQLQVSTDSTFQSAIVDDSTLTAPSREVRGLIPGFRYWWRVRATNKGGWGEYSEVWSFLVGTPATVFLENRRAGVASARTIPNPFADRTTLVIAIDRPAQFSMSVVDLLGRPVAARVDRAVAAGEQDI